jgi:hypothetical protein
MKKQKNLFLFLLTLFLIEANGQKKPVTLSLISGTSITSEALSYGIGVGVKAGLSLNKVYVGIATAVYTGENTTIRYGAVPSLGIQSGTQKYDSGPKLIMIDGGYDIKLAGDEKLSCIFTPYLSTGLVSINMRSSGVYGESKVTDSRLAFGGGLMVNVLFGSNFSFGLEQRMYPIGDAEFTFGEGSGEIDHGFSTSVFYAALHTVVAYRFNR